MALFDYAVRRTGKAVRGTVVSLPALERNFEAGRQWTVAEPLYIALALAGEKDAYEISKRLAELCRDREMGLLDYLHTPEGGEIVDRLPPELQRVVLDPRQYTGDSAARTRLVCDMWWGGDGSQGRVHPLDRLTAPLGRPPDEVALAATMSAGAAGASAADGLSPAPGAMG